MLCADGVKYIILKPFSRTLSRKILLFYQLLVHVGEAFEILKMSLKFSLENFTFSLDSIYLAENLVVLFLRTSLMTKQVAREHV
jgi:hypothetical protein